MGNVVLELRNIKKVFPGVTALNNVSIQLEAGQVHGLIGENGAGKSTLIKVMTGTYIPEEGEIYINGEKTVYRGPLDAKRKGVTCVYQELNISRQMSVTDNIFIGNFVKKKSGLLDYAYMDGQARELMESMGQKIDVHTECGKLGIGQQQMVEIAKGIYSNAKVFILDEPTASLGQRETAELMRLVKRLKEQGLAILFVSHKIEEIFELCDVVTIMRNAKHVATKKTSELTPDSLVAMMVGHTVEDYYPKYDTVPGEVALEVKNLNRAGEFYDFSFTARRGQITAFAGLVGAGRTELFRGIFGAEKIESGEIYIDGKQVKIRNPLEAIRAGLAYLTEDRKNQGLLLERSIKENLTIVGLDRYAKGPFIDNPKIDKIVEKNIAELRIVTSSPDKLAGDLSGGNQQKVVIGKWLNSNAEIYVFDEPTKGIDVGAKVEVYNLMGKLATAGKCVIMISSELPEVLGISDRVIVMRTGRKMAEIDRGSKHFNQESIMQAAWGGKLDD